MADADITKGWKCASAVRRSPTAWFIQGLQDFRDFGEVSCFLGLACMPIPCLRGKLGPGYLHEVPEVLKSPSVLSTPLDSAHQRLSLNAALVVGIDDLEATDAAGDDLPMQD